MKALSGSFTSVWAQRVCAVLLAGMALASVGYAQTFTAGQKGKLKGTIISRSGDLVKVQDKKTGSTAVVKVTEDTKMLRDKHTVSFHRHEDMDVTALVPGLTISVEGMGNASGGLDASKITFNPDEFAIEVAEEQQIMANQSAAAKAQSTGNNAQASANNAQASANNAQATGDLAVTGAAMDMNAVQMVNERVSDLGDYNKVAQAVIFYPSGESTLDDAAKADLDKLAALALSTDGYMIEIAGYASKTGSKSENQQLSEDRAEAVATYLRDQKNIPMRRILAPAGYGATHPDATNNDAQGRELNRRVDVTLIVNKGLQGSM